MPVRHLNEFRKLGHDCVEDFDTLKEQVELGISYRHQFLVLDGTDERINWRWFSDYRDCLPYRILVLGNILDSASPQLCRTMVEIKPAEVAILLSDPKSLKLFLWQKWVLTHFNRYKLLVRWAPRFVLHQPAIFEFLDQDDSSSSKQNGMYKLIYDHHEKPERDTLFKTASFHYSFASNQPIANLFMPLKGNHQSTIGQKIELFRLWETSAISVAVIDERVWLERNAYAREGVSKYEDNSEFRIVKNVWEKRRVYFLDSDDAKANFSNFVQTKLKPPNETECYDFVIIHQGIIDEIKREFGDEYFDSTWTILRDKARFVVIDTGRGHPDQATKENLRWVEYSNLAECLITFAGDKLRLARLLFALQAKFSREGKE